MRKLVPIAAVAALLLTACGSGEYAATEIPAKPSPTTPSPTTPSPTTSTAKPPTIDCEEPLASYQPTGPLPDPGDMPVGTRMGEIQRRGRLIAGVSADSLNLGARNPISGQIEGFDIDMVKAVGRAIFADFDTNPKRLELRVISSPQRIPALRDTKNPVDIVARNMTINCERWQQIAFSAEYYRAGQKTLVPRDSTAKSLADLDGETICAPAGSTSLANLKREYPDVKPITADTDTGCLVLFQQGKAYGVTGDDTVLAGEAAQDPYAKVLDHRFSDEPYGLGIPRQHRDFVRFVNAVLEQIKANGDWTKSYNKWLKPTLGPDRPAPAPPKPIYGRGS